MKKEDIVRECKAFVRKFHLQPEEFIIGAGAACLMYGLREVTDDVDACIDNELFDKLLKNNEDNLSYFGDVEVLSYNKYIDLHRKLQHFDTRIVEGICCYSPQELLAQKQKLNRPKDQKDIFALQKLIENEKKQKPAFSRWVMETQVKAVLGSHKRKVKGFDRIESNEENVKEYKKQFSNLSHVKTGRDFEGVILLDVDDAFVAVLQCNTKTGYIVALEVSKEYQRQGIAQALLKLAQDEFKCPKLTVNKKNSAAISLYEKVGYEAFKEEGVMLYMEKT